MRQKTSNTNSSGTLPAASIFAKFQHFVVSKHHFLEEVFDLAKNQIKIYIVQFPVSQETSSKAKLSVFIGVMSIPKFGSNKQVRAQDHCL